MPIDSTTVTATGQAVQTIGVPVALVVLLFMIYSDLRPIIRQVVSDWIALHIAVQAARAKALIENLPK